MSDSKKTPPAPTLSLPDQIESIELIDPRHSSLSHKLYKEAETLLTNLFKDAHDPEKELSVTDKTKIINCLLKFRTSLFGDPHFLIKCLEKMSLEDRQMFYMMADKHRLQEALRNPQKSKILS